MQLILGILVLIFVVVPLVLYYILRSVAIRSLPPTSPGRALAVIPIGFIFYALLVFALIALLTIAGQARENALGKFLHRPGGLIIGIAVLVTVGAFVERALRRLGHPVMRSVWPRDV